MSDLETRLTAALQAGAPPARDVRFRVDVLVRLEQARFRRRVGLSVLVAAVMAVLAAVIAPTLDEWAADVQLWTIALSGTVVLFALLAAQLAGPAGVRALVRTFGRWLYS